MMDAQHNTTPKKRPRWAKAFLAMLRESGNIRLACETVGIERSTAYDLRKSDTTFAADWEQAQDDAADLLEQEARRRAYEGWDEPVFGSMGAGRGSGQVGLVRKFDSTLLIFLLKGARPEKYRERQQIEHTGKDGGPVEIADARSQLATVLSRALEGRNASGAAGGDSGAAATSRNDTP